MKILVMKVDMSFKVTQHLGNAEVTDADRIEMQQVLDDPDHPDLLQIRKSFESQLPEGSELTHFKLTGFDVVEI